MPGRLLAVVMALGILVLATPIVAQRGPADLSVNQRRSPSTFSGLDPGSFVVHKQKVPIDIVLIGFDSSQINRNDLSALLPATYAPAVRYPQFYGLNGRNVGLEYEFKYSYTRKSRTFEEQFFRYLTRIGTPAAPTVYQLAYNSQVHNLVDVTGPVLYIDAPSVEKWLANNANPRTDGYTVYFINWFGRSDFKFHLYTKTDDPDPDTKFNFGALARSAISSWGGTRSRSWFYDFSAGPEWNTTNWVVDAKDLDNDTVEEYRMPPIWEYAVGGYRAPDALGYDIGLLTRYVAIDLLFTPSPLYDPLITQPGALGRKVADITMFEDDGDVAAHGTQFLDAAFAKNAWERFEPYYRWKTTVREIDPIDAGPKEALGIFSLTALVPGCWQGFGTPFAQLFCFFSEHRDDYVPQYPARDYVAPIISYHTTQANLGVQSGLLGFADDNWVDGTQSMVFTFDTAAYRQAGYGFTATMVHEVGHHMGMSHPHDGFDPETGVDFGAEQDFYFAWAGDESDTVMHYLSVSNQFGEHNKDNMYRWEAAGYLNWANALAGDILASPSAPKVWLALVAADAQAAVAQARLDRWDFLTAVERARASYLLLVAAADEIGVSSARLSAARMRLPERQIRKYICRPRQLVEILQGTI